MGTPRFYSPDVSSIHMELAGWDSNNSTIDFDDELLLSGMGQFSWGLDGFSYDSSQVNPAPRATKKRKLQDASVPPIQQPGSETQFPSTSTAIPARHTPPVYDLTSPPSTANASLLSQILDIFPDISHCYVEGLIARQEAVLPQASQVDNGLRMIHHEQTMTKDNIIEEILDNSPYPKQEKAKRKKANDDYGWTPDTPYQGDSVSYSQIATQILAKEFPNISIQYIRQAVSNKKRLYHAYLAIFAEDSLPLQSEKSYGRLKKKRNSSGPNLAMNNGPSLPFMNDMRRELVSAREKIEKELAKRRKRREEEEAEKRNEDEHTRAGNLIECQCCYLDVPSNRSIPCEGISVHFFCFTCIRKSAETQLGLMRYKLQCFDVSGCGAKFARYRLEDALGSKLIEKLDTLEQLDEIQNACLDGLEDCPFCSFKAICPPVGEDREFRCNNPACEIVSCRLCKEKSHIPLTCEESRKEKGLSERHEVEEAMSKALIRNCPKCGLKIIKEAGCNKMTCTKCQCMMCYICGKDISREKYKHFGRGCSQDDAGREDRYRKEVQEAEKTTIKKILIKNPELTQEDLHVRHPKSTKKAQPPRPPLVPQPLPRMGPAQLLVPPQPPVPYYQGLQAQHTTRQRVEYNGIHPQQGTRAEHDPHLEPEYCYLGGLLPTPNLPLHLDGANDTVTLQSNTLPTFPQNIQSHNQITEFPLTPASLVMNPHPSHFSHYTQNTPHRGPNPTTQYRIP